MSKTDTSEKGLETLIMRHMTGADGLGVTPNSVAERQPAYGGTGYTAGSPQDYDRAHALDVAQLFAFGTARLILPQLSSDVREGKVAPAILLAAMSISIGIVNAAAMAD